MTGDATVESAEASAIDHRSFARELAWAVVVVVAATAPVAWSPRFLTGYDRGEADNHRWMLWQAAHPGVVWSNLPDGTAIPLIDPVHLPAFALGLLAGPSEAWNLVLVQDVVAAVVGGAWLAVRATRSRSAAPIGMMLALAPAFQGVVAFGLTEAWTLGWLALFLGGWLGYCREGSRWDAAAAAVGLSAYGLSGGYAWFFGAISVIGAMIWAPPPRARWAGVAAILGVTALVSAPSVMAFLSARSAWSTRTHPVVSWRYLDGWQDAPVGGTDALALVLPRLPVPSGRSTYLGVSSLLLAVAGARRQAVPVVLAALFGWLSLGLVVRVAGTAVAPGVALGLHALGFHWIHHWYRAVGPMVVWLIPAAAQGAVWLSAGKRRVPELALAALIGVESVAVGGNPWPNAQYDTTPPEGIRTLTGDGGLLVLPWDEPGEFDLGVPRPFERWGPELGRPLAVAYDSPPVLRDRVRLAAALNRACGGDDARPFSDPSQLTPEVADAGRQQLAAAGVRELAVWTARAPSPSLCADVAARALGAPDRVAPGGVLVWRLGDAPAKHR